MKITPQTLTVNPHDELLLCFDVSKATLTLFSQYQSNGRTFRIERLLQAPCCRNAVRHCDR